MHRHRHTKECSKAEITSWDLKLDAERIHVVKAAAVTGQGYVSTIDFKEQLGPWQKSCYCKVDIQAVDLIKNHIHGLNSNHFQIVHNLHIDNMKRSCCLPYTTFQSMSFSQIEQILGKQRHTKEINGPSSSSVVTWVIRARFLTSPQASPSGVSHGQSIPHCYTN